MKYRRLGSTGPEVSEIGFGAWGIGGNANGAVAYGPADENESKNALRRAFDLGINFFDTSDFYGFGRSEELIGQALKQVRSRIVIATKVGLLSAAGDQDFSAGHIRRAVENSLRRLQTDYLDLYQLHSPSIKLLERDDTILTSMQALQAEGKIRAVGVSVRSPDDGLIVARNFNVGCIQVNFNMIDQRARENGLLALCSDRGIGVIARTPLCFGFLSGKYSVKQDFGPFDHRSKWSSAQIECWADAYRLFVGAVKNGGDHTPAQLALRYCLSSPGVSTVIPGMLTNAHVEENAAASDLGAIPGAELHRIGEIYDRHSFFEQSAS